MDDTGCIVDRKATHRTTRNVVDDIRVMIYDVLCVSEVLVDMICYLLVNDMS